MKADPEAQRRLLDLQAIDTALNQLAHRRRHLPEHADIERLGRETRILRDERARAQVAVDDLDRDIARIERDTEQVRARKDRDQVRLDAGTGPARELEALQHELASLQRRQSELEDAELALMEQRESAVSVLSGVQARQAAAEEQRAAAETRRDEILADLAKDEEFRTSGRRPLVSDLPTDLVALYERIREQSGIGAALLRSGRCEGCRLDLSGMQRSKVKAAAPDEVIRCDECGRILVRTAESGL